MKLAHNKKTILIGIASFLFLLSTVYSDFFYDVNGGVAIDLPQNAEIRIRAFFATQIQFGDSLLFNGGFSIRTTDILADKFAQNIPSSFFLDEISLLYRFTIQDSIGHVALFFGEYESAGTDIFVRRHFGIDKIHSNLFKTQIGYKPVNIFSIDGLGVAVTTRLPQPIAIAFYAYSNEKPVTTDGDSEDTEHINLDLRIAGATQSFIGDLVFGVNLPLTTKNNAGEDVVLFIERADFHAGLTMLIGNNSRTNWYIQLGVTKIQMDPLEGEILELEDLYIFLEPRFKTEKINFAISVFSLPEDTSNRIQYIDHTTTIDPATGEATDNAVVGLSVSLESNGMNILTNKAVIGGFLTASIPHPAIDTIPFDIANLSVQLVPYAELSMGDALINISIQIRALEYLNIKNMFALSASYTMRL